MFGFQEVLESEIHRILSECETEEERSAFLERHDEFISEVTDEMAESLLETVKEDAFSSDLEAFREERRQFERRVVDFWGMPINLLELFITIAFEAGMTFGEKHSEAAAKSDDYVFEVLTRLHAKACQTSNAILALLRSGFADDAYARWRSLHEIAVIASFIRAHGQETAERYLLHEVMQQYKLARDQMEVHGRNNAEKIYQKEIDALKARHDALVERFGSKFKADYGWADGALGGRHPSIRAMEKQVQLDHLKPYYRMASDNVHANSHGKYFRLGVSLAQDRKKILLAGPSTAGLADPGHATAISLGQITTLLLVTQPSLDINIAMATLAILEKEVGEAFLEMHKKHESVVRAKTEKMDESTGSSGKTEPI